MICEVYFIVVFSNGMISRGETRINLSGVDLAFLTDEGTIFSKKKIPGEKSFFGDLVGFQ